MAKIPVHAILGVDAGGTFTRYVVYDLAGNEIDRVIGESIHFMKVGFDGMRTALEGVKESLDYVFDFVGIGTAGYGKDPLIRKQIEDAIYPVFEGAIIMSDAQFAMLSALEGEPGGVLYFWNGLNRLHGRRTPRWFWLFN